MSRTDGLPAPEQKGNAAATRGQAGRTSRRGSPSARSGGGWLAVQPPQPFLDAAGVAFEERLKISYRVEPWRGRQRMAADDRYRQPQRRERERRVVPVGHRRHLGGVPPDNDLGDPARERPIRGMPWRGKRRS